MKMLKFVNDVMKNLVKMNNISHLLAKKLSMFLKVEEYKLQKIDRSKNTKETDLCFTVNNVAK